MTDMRSRVALILFALARALFYALAVLIPVRLRATLASRPVGNIYGDYTDFLFFATDGLLLGLLACWLTACLLASRLPRRPVGTMLVPLAGFTILAALGAPASLDIPLSLYHAVRLVTLAGLVMYMVDQLRSPLDLVKPVSVQIGLQSVVAIGQFARQSDLGLQRLGEYLLNPEWSGVSIIFDHSQRWLRAYGLSDHPNILGGCLTFGLLILLGVSLQGNPGRRLKQIWYALIFALGNLALFVTFSRAAWLALVVAGVFLLTLHVRSGGWGRLRPLWLPAGLTAVCLLPIVFSQRGLVFTRLQTPGAPDQSPTELQALGERAILNHASLDVFLARPILGSGLGTLPQAIRLANPQFGPYYQPAHIVLVSAAAETGLLGATLYAVLLTIPGLQMVFRRDLRTSTTGWTVAAGLLAVAVVGLFDYYPWLLQPGRLWQYLLWGAWAVGLRDGTGGSAPGG